jgi:hypothetical protein
MAVSRASAGRTAIASSRSVDLSVVGEPHGGGRHVPDRTDLRDSRGGPLQIVARKILDGSAIID